MTNLSSKQKGESSGRMIPMIYLSLALIFFSYPLFSQSFIAGHSVAKEEVLRQIPVEFINKARQELVIAYQHTSHGTHVAWGVFGLQDYKTGDTLLFGVSESPAPDTLEFRDRVMADYAPPGVDAADLSRDETAFIQTTRNYLDAPENASVNVVMWSWCDIAGHNVANNYLPGMDSLISEYGPGGTGIDTAEGYRQVPVTFIRMTGHANVNANVGDTLRTKAQADTIINYSMANQQYCLDYYSIDTHDMEDNYWEDAGDDGNSSAYGGNFYTDWQNSHVLGEDYFENKESPGGLVTYGEHNTQHITANRKAYAMWWILARIAGWDGSHLLSDIQISSPGDTSQVMTGDTLRFSATVMPDFADNQELVWSVINGGGSATISTEGLLRGGQPGPVQVVALALDGSGVADTLDLIITDPLVPVTDITLSTAGGLIELDGGSSLQCSATVLPDTASNPQVLWSVNNLTGTAQISQDGLLLGQTEGSVEVIATAEDGSLVADTLLLSISSSVIFVSDIEITSAGGVTSVVVDEELQLTATVLPVDASNPVVEWSVINGTGSATVSSDGLLRGGSPGTVEVVALASDLSGVGDTMSLSIVELEVPVTGITLTTAGGVTEFDQGSTLQCLASVLPVDATNLVLSWSVVEGTGSATVSSNGLLTAQTAGTIDVVATATDGSGVSNFITLTVRAAVVMVSDILIYSAGDATTVEAGNSLQFSASVLPSNATNSTLEWSVIDGTGTATICECATLNALTPGSVDVVAAAMDASGVSSTFALTILGPSGVIDESSGSMIILYPNPSMGKFYLNAGELQIDRLEVISTAGSVVLEQVPDSGDRLIELDLSDQQPGVFFIHAFSEEKSYIQRIIISR